MMNTRNILLPSTEHRGVTSRWAGLVCYQRSGHVSYIVTPGNSLMKLR